MRPSLLDILRCPGCGGHLKLSGENINGESDVGEGYLLCATCTWEYVISDGIPDLIPVEDERSVTI